MFSPLLIFSLAYHGFFLLHQAIVTPRPEPIVSAVADVPTAEETSRVEQKFANLDNATGPTTFTDDELSALFQACDGTRCLVSNVRVHTEDDGALTFSGNITRDTIKDFLHDERLDDAQMSTLEAIVSALPANTSFSATAMVTGSDDVLDFTILGAQIAHVPVPSFLLSDINHLVTDSLNNYLQRQPGIQVHTIEITADGIRIDAKFE